ncbi:hypothetical protein [Actinoplanes sp. NBRC 101535]|uniref:hypothetical protein n=1 Tax=Actinoplanes sp. NBRC 101535 TaxID=3032196 RepID=UPI0024A3AA50|nr:hypothetical protein [Actinoplanes sp. NBRC 101535]GLY08256.1 hypothetical protein Acsp01_86350 [Actinoplanes sp. NBRC 101535]
MGEQKRYGDSTTRRLDRITAREWHQLYLAVQDRIETISQQPASPERSDALAALRPLLERLSQ